MEHDLFNLSANISFYAILSLPPLAMIFVSVIGYVVGTGDIVEQIVHTVTDVIPGAKPIFLSNLQNLMEQRSKLGIWGVGFLLIVSTVLFSSLEGAFDKIFEVEKKRNFLVSRLLAIGVIFIIVVLLFLPFAMRTIQTFMQNYDYSVPLIAYISGKAFFVIFGVLAFTIVIMIVPHQRVYLRYAFLGGIIFATGVAIAKFIFQWYLGVALHRYNLVYGSLTAVILMVIWIYYMTLILLISAEVVAFLQNRRKINGRK